MIGITDYLTGIFNDFKNEINNGRDLCELKGLTFESNFIPDYKNLQIQRLYLLRYAFSYAFEYSQIYLSALDLLGCPNKISVASVGCGNYLDYWALVNAIEKKHIYCSVHYTGIDQIDWSYKINRRNCDEVYFIKGNAEQLFQDNSIFDSDVYFFPKSISEFKSDEVNSIAKNFSKKPIKKDKIVLCFSLRANDHNMESDAYRTKKIINAFELNGYNNKTGDEIYCIKENKGIRAYDYDFVYPQEILDYIENLDKKCYKYNDMFTNCKEECKSYLTRKPTMRTDNIVFQIIELERKQR